MTFALALVITLVAGVFLIVPGVTLMADRKTPNQVWGGTLMVIVGMWVILGMGAAVAP